MLINCYSFKWQFKIKNQELNLQLQRSLNQYNFTWQLLYQFHIGVEVLESIADPRFAYFHNKIHALMLKKHIVKKLHQASGNSMNQSITVANKAQLKDKKDQYQINFFFNQGQVDIKKVQLMLAIAENKQIQVEGKIKTDIKRQQQQLEERIKNRKMRSQAGSVKKYKQYSQKQIATPNPIKKQSIKDPRMQYFQISNQKLLDFKPKNKAIRTNSGSLQKIFLQRKYGLTKTPATPVSEDKHDYKDAI